MPTANELENYMNYTYTYHLPTFVKATGTVAATPIVTQPLKTTFSDSCSVVYATTYDLDKMARKIYKIIEEHCRIDITEEEFMELLKED